MREKNKAAKNVERLCKTTTQYLRKVRPKNSHALFEVAFVDDSQGGGGGEFGPVGGHT
jgi:hypothetical protein